MNVNYDSGASSMALPISDLVPMMAPNTVSVLPTKMTSTASGQGQACYTVLDVRVLSRDATKVLTPWERVHCCGYVGIRQRIFRGSLENTCFVCNQPHRQHLYVAYTKNQLINRMPKG